VDDTLPGVGRTVADELLTPTRIYVKAVLGLLRALPVRAMAHVTGGGISENLPRVLPEGCRAQIRPSSWPAPPIFRVLQDAGGIEEAEMRRTFNMGIGYLVVVRPEDAEPARALLRGAGEEVFEIGEIEAGAREVRYA
jgi:phosphoribosylformylglycinamidine cyclo-ligase